MLIKKICFGAVLFLGMLMVNACSTSETMVEKPAATPLEEMYFGSDVFSGNFTGFVLYDPESDQTVFEDNGHKYFTPASNTKLYTFYASLKELPATMPLFRYRTSGDSLIIWGMGNPTFMHPDFDSEEALNFLKNTDKDIYYSDAHYRDELLGPGWSWGDYQYYYSTEKSPFPMYGNVVEFKIEDISITRLEPAESGEGFNLSPAIMNRFVNDSDSSGAEDDPLIFRDFNDNEFVYRQSADTVRYSTYRPFHYTPELITAMLSEETGKKVSYIDMPLPEEKLPVYFSGDRDSVLANMLQPSDNFLAEQLLLNIAALNNLEFSSEAAIQYTKKEYMQNMPADPVWEDGSGLSRYNMFTPHTTVELLKRIDAEFSNDSTMFSYFPAGGIRGTIRNWYANRNHPDQPYVFAKTGTLRNNHCLSGYVITEKGTKYLFSFMNNHYTGPSSEVKTEMEKILWHIYENM